MGYTNLNLGLNLTIPTSGTKNWADTLKNTTWTKISQHKHQGSGDGGQIPTGGIADNSITTAKLSKNYGYTQAATLTPAGTTQAIDFANGNVQTLDLSSATGTVTVSFSNPSAGSIYWIWIVHGATFRDITWPASVKWPQAQAPIMSDGAGKVDLVILNCVTTSLYRGIWELDFS